MRVCECVRCGDFACAGVSYACYRVPEVEVEPDQVRMVMVSEAAAPEPKDDFYAGEDALFSRTTLQAFRHAGAGARSIQELLDAGVYFTTAVKCAKTAHAIRADTVKACSRLLEQELALFPHARVLMLMGDVAIQALNCIARRTTGKRALPAGSTYKIRGVEYWYQGRRVFPSYLQAGPAYYVEAGKRTMIAEDLARALALLR